MARAPRCRSKQQCQRCTAWEPHKPLWWWPALLLTARARAATQGPYTSCRTLRDLRLSFTDVFKNQFTGAEIRANFSFEGALTEASGETCAAWAARNVHLDGEARACAAATDPPLVPSIAGDGSTRACHAAYAGGCSEPQGACAAGRARRAHAALSRHDGRRQGLRRRGAPRCAGLMGTSRRPRRAAAGQDPQQRGGRGASPGPGHVWTNEPRG